MTMMMMMIFDDDNDDDDDDDLWWCQTLEIVIKCNLAVGDTESICNW